MIRTIKYALDTPLLCRMIDYAAEKEFNRQIDPDLKAKLDPQGMHLCHMEAYMEGPVTRLVIMVKLAEWDKHQKPPEIVVDTTDAFTEQMVKITNENLRDMLQGRPCSECGLHAYHRRDDYICFRCREKVAR